MRKHPYGPWSLFEWVLERLLLLAKHFLCFHKLYQIFYVPVFFLWSNSQDTCVGIFKCWLISMQIIVVFFFISYFLHFWAVLTQVACKQFRRKLIRLATFDTFVQISHFHFFILIAPLNEGKQLVSMVLVPLVWINSEILQTLI